jgi:hypothetical protein
MRCRCMWRCFSISPQILPDIYAPPPPTFPNLMSCLLVQELHIRYDDIACPPHPLPQLTPTPRWRPSSYLCFLQILHAQLVSRPFHTHARDAFSPHLRSAQNSG